MQALRSKEDWLEQLPDAIPAPSPLVLAVWNLFPHILCIHVHLYESLVCE